MVKLVCKACFSTSSFEELGIITVSRKSYKVYRCACGAKTFIPLSGWNL